MKCKTLKYRNNEQYLKWRSTETIDVHFSKHPSAGHTGNEKEHENLSNVVRYSNVINYTGANTQYEQ